MQENRGTNNIVPKPQEVLCKIKTKNKIKNKNKQQRAYHTH
jgi:hypothetical protein